MLLKATQYKSSSQLVLLVLIFTVFFAGNVFAAEKQSSATTKLKLLFETKMKSVNTYEVRDLITAGANVDIITKHGLTPLGLTSIFNNIDLIKLLLEAGADANKASSRDDSTPMIFASYKGHAGIIKLLIAAKADLNKPMTTGATPLIIASQEGHADILQLLLTANADINATTKHNGDEYSALREEYSALRMARMSGHSGIVKLLKEYGAKE